MPESNGILSVWGGSESTTKYEKTTQIGDVYTTITIEGNVNDVIQILKADESPAEDKE